MSYLLIIILFTILQFFAGFGVLTLSRIRLKRGIFIPLCLLTGVAVFSIVPFLLQLIYIPITRWSVFISLLLVCILLNWQLRAGIKLVREHWRNTKFNIKLYEIPALLVITALVLISVWRCFYYPPTPRDLNSGAEAIAEYAVREGSMVNSVFSVDVSINAFKPPSVTSLQIIYKLAGFPFGQVWLSTVFISFIFFLYHVLSEKVHRLIAGLLLIFFITVPELYAYIFMVLHDYSNAVFFCCALYFLFRSFEDQLWNSLLFGALLMSVATYFRSETLLFAFLLVPLIIFRNRKHAGRAIYFSFLFLLPALLVYVISVPVYINFYLPLPYPVTEQINPELTNLQPFFRRLADMNTRLLFSERGIIYFGYFIFIFLLIFLADLLVVRRMSRETANWLYAILVVYLGLPLLGFLLPMVDLDSFTKRGLQKMFPLMLLYMGNTPLLIGLSKRINRWERKAQ